MDIITANQLPTDLPWLEICIFFGSVIFVVTFFNYVVLSPDEERPVSFKIPIPEQCSPNWKGEVLEEPSIKVLRRPSSTDAAVSQWPKADGADRSMAPAPSNATIQPTAASLVWRTRIPRTESIERLRKQKKHNRNGRRLRSTSEGRFLGRCSITYWTTKRSLRGWPALTLGRQ